MDREFVIFKGRRIMVRNGILDLRQNGITNIADLEGLSNLTTLRELNLSGNEIRTLENLPILPDLKRLDLSLNQITVIRNLDKLVSLEELNLNDNNIYEIEWLNNLINLKKLRLDSNDIREITGLEKLDNLQELDLLQNPLIKTEKEFAKRFRRKTSFWRKIEAKIPTFADINKILVYSKKKAYDLLKVKSMLKYENEQQRDLQKGEIRLFFFSTFHQEVGREDVEHYFELLNSPINYSSDEIPILNSKLEKLPVELVNPTLYDFLIIHDFNLSVAKKLGKYLVEIEWIKDFPKFYSSRNNENPVGEDEISQRIPLRNLFESKSLETILKNYPSQVIDKILPRDVFEKGKQMKESYFCIYCIENSLRLFINKIIREKFGDSFIDKITLNHDIRVKLNDRKNNEKKNKWLPVRGDSDLFYIDFKELSNVIKSNWELFKNCFPDQDWICTKINDLAECRNLIAHSNYLEDEQKGLVWIYFNIIFRQLAKKL